MSVFREKSGYDGTDVGRLHQPGSHGLTFDAQGRLTACEHGNRRITRTEPDGKLTVLADRFEGKRLNNPNGIAFSPDERWLYVSNWDEKAKIIMRYAVQADGSLRDGKVWFDMTAAPGAEALDGLKVDARGNVYASGPGGVWVISPAARHLGTLRLPQLPVNFAWGDADRKALYFTARSAVYKVRLNVAGAGSPRVAADASR